MRSIVHSEYLPPGKTISVKGSSAVFASLSEREETKIVLEKILAASARSNTCSQRCVHLAVPGWEEHPLTETISQSSWFFFSRSWRGSSRRGDKQGGRNCRAEGHPRIILQTVRRNVSKRMGKRTRLKGDYLEEGNLQFVDWDWSKFFVISAPLLFRHISYALVTIVGEWKIVNWNQLYFV